jgi:hypothetical protein
MQFIVIVHTSKVIVDNVPVVFDFSDLIDADISVVRWNNGEGEIEYTAHYKPNKKITSISNFQTIISRYNQEKTAQQQGRDDAEAAMEAALTYRQRRQREYPNPWAVIESVLEELKLSGVTPGSKLELLTTQIDTIKAKYPEV